MNETEKMRLVVVGGLVCFPFVSSGPLLLALADDAFDGLPDFIKHGHALAVGKVRQVRPAPVVVLERRLAQPLLSASLSYILSLDYRLTERLGCGAQVFVYTTHVSSCKCCADHHFISNLLKLLMKDQHNSRAFVCVGTRIWCPATQPLR